MTNSIPISSMQEGISLIHENIQSLLDSASLLHNNGKYILSASLTIFAFEEISKAELLLNRYNEKRELSEDDWKKYTKGSSAHLNKLLEFLSKERIPQFDFTGKNITYSKEEIDDMVAKWFQALKTHVFYVNWTKEGWFWFPKEYPENLQEFIATWLLNVAKRRFQALQKSP